MSRERASQRVGKRQQAGGKSGSERLLLLLLCCWENTRTLPVNCAANVAVAVDDAFADAGNACAPARCAAAGMAAASAAAAGMGTGTIHGIPTRTRNDVEGATG